jgi:ketosteroid isomerase-like protein
MSSALTVIRDLYHAMEQGNIGKLFSLLDHTFAIQGPLGTDRTGREGVLDIVSNLYRQGKGIKKEIDHFIEYENMVIVLGNVHMNQTESTAVKMPFVDIWKLQDNKITELQYFYQDPPLLARFLSDKD